MDLDLAEPGAGRNQESTFFSITLLPLFFMWSCFYKSPFSVYIPCILVASFLPCHFGLRYAS